MIERRSIIILPGQTNIMLRIGAETFILFMQSLIWPMVDSYYVTLLYAHSMAIGKEAISASVEATHIVKRIQWLSEALYEEKVIKYFEACNIESIKNAVATFKEMGVLQQKSVFILLADQYRNDESKLTKILDQINQYRCHSNI